MKQVNVLETPILYASDVIYWLDGSSAQSASDMQRINSELVLQLDTRPTDLQLLHTRGKTVLWRRADGKIVAGNAEDADKQRSESDTFMISGIVSDLQRRYIPRRFSLEVGDSAGHQLELYPTPFGTRLGRGGALQGTLRLVDGITPVPWAMMTLIVDLTVGDDLIIHAQADEHGDFVIAMHRLPPLLESVEHYSATLSIRASIEATADEPVDPADLVSMRLGSIDVEDSFADAINLFVVPGSIGLIRSFERDHVVVQPS